MNHFSLTSRCAGETAAAYTRRAHGHMEDLEAKYGSNDWRPFAGGQALYHATATDEMVAYVNTDQMK